MLWLLLSATSMADTFTLDNGVTIEGVLAQYNMGGSCQISIEEGDLSGAIVVIPCDRIMSFQRVGQSADAPALTSTVAPIEEVVPTPAPLALPAPDAVPEAAPFSETPVFEPAPEVPAIPVPAPEAVALPAPADVPEVARAETAPDPEEPLWADEDGQPVEEGPAPQATPDQKVALPALPNLRMLRRPNAEGDVAEEEEAPNQL